MGQMALGPESPESRVAARLRAFQLVRELQGGDPGALARLEELTAAAERAGWTEVIRVGFYGRAVDAWFRSDMSRLDRAVSGLVEVGRSHGDDCVVALGLAMRAAFVDDGDGAPSAAFDQDLAEAVTLLEKAVRTAASSGVAAESASGALEMISAHTVCGIAFDSRSLWELGDEQYAAALELAGAAEAGIGDILLSAVMFDRAEAHVSWAGWLYQIGDREALARRWSDWLVVGPASVTFAMPETWHTELATLGYLMAALAGQDVTADAGELLRQLASATSPDPLPMGHLKLARALSLWRHPAGSDSVQRCALAEEAVEAINPGLHPHLYGLALYVGAEVESDGDRPTFGLRGVRHQVTRRWADRLAKLDAMRSRIEAERMRSDLHRVSLEVARDDLTGLGNRRALASYAADMEGRGVGRVGVIMIDVDHFKQVNDRYGHDVGDLVLARVASILQQAVRPADIAVRLGGDEFMVVLADVDLQVASERAAAIIDHVERQSWAEIHDGLVVSLSIGVASGNRAGLDAVRAAADRAVYESKRAGGHCVTAQES